MGRRDEKARHHARVRPQGIIELTAQGYGFVKTAEGEFFIPKSKTGDAFPGDLVELSIIHDAQNQKGGRGGSGTRNSGGGYGFGTSLATGTGGGRRVSARVTKVLMRCAARLVGTYEVAEPFGVVVPENPAIHHDIFTLRSDNPDIADGSLVEVEIIEYPSRNSAATGRVVRVLGAADDPRVEVDCIIAEHGLETEFSDAVCAEARACQAQIEEATRQGYKDSTSEFVFTVDPYDARDFDDAVSCSYRNNRYYLTVHIADVSAYVDFDSAIDCTARRRATSVYLVDRVLPMLPEVLSNDLCSLMPGVERRALSVQAVIRNDGSVESYSIYPSIIRSKARLSYEQALILIDNEYSPASEPESSHSAHVFAGQTSCSEAVLQRFRHAVLPHGSIALGDATIGQLQTALTSLYNLSQCLFKRRYRNGCMNFDRVEARALLNDEGYAVGVTYRRRTKATQAIEEAMILANNLVAQWLQERDMPCVYRVHDVPDAESLRVLWPILQEMDAYRSLDKQELIAGNPAVLQEVLRIAQLLPERELISTLVLRAMKRAHYTTSDDPHFGLALQHYCHFTSPIRRYPDLLVHRMIKQSLFGKTESFEAQKNALAWMAEHASKQERIAERASRDSQKLKIIEYLEQYVGQRFEGVVSGVSTFGLTIRLETTVQGLLPTEELGDEYFAFDHERYCLRGTDTGVRYRLGQRMSVVLVQADHRQRTLRFAKPYVL